LAFLFKEASFLFIILLKGTIMKATRGRPKGTNSYSLKPEVLDKFLQRVYQGQSITMLCWEFKLKPFQE
jgi:hypothetical protein